MITPIILKYIGIGIGVLALIAVIVLGVTHCKKIDQQNANMEVNSGAIQEREATHAEVINHVSEAQNVVTNPTANDVARVCDTYDRNCPHRK